MQLTRRGMLIGAGTVCLAGVAVVANPNLFYSALTEDFDGETLDPVAAHAAATGGQILLIDIRRPDEWARTGSGEGAHRIDMRDDDFVTQLSILAQDDRDAPVALICARGVRSARLSNRLKGAGFTRIIDVPEGMLGSSAGPGWLARGLPLNKEG